MSDRKRCIIIGASGMAVIAPSEQAETISEVSSTERIRRLRRKTMNIPD